MKVLCTLLAAAGELGSANPRPLDPDVPRAVVYREGADEADPIVRTNATLGTAKTTRMPPPSGADKPRRTRSGTGCFPARARCFRLTSIGIASASFGLAALAGGIALIALPERPYAGEPAFLKSYRAPGIGVAVAGATVLVTGIVLILAGHASHRQTSKRSATMGWLPVWGTR